MRKRKTERRLGETDSCVINEGEGRWEKGKISYRGGNKITYLVSNAEASPTPLYLSLKRSLSE